MSRKATKPLVLRAAVGIFAASTLLLSACSDVPEDEAAIGVEEEIAEEEPVEDELVEGPIVDGPYVGPVSENFVQDMVSREGQEVSVTASIAEVVSPQVFTIGATGQPAVEPVLVLSPTGVDGLEPLGDAEVSGVVYTSFDPDQLPEAASDIQLDPAEADEMRGKAFIVADEVTVSAPAG